MKQNIQSDGEQLCFWDGYADKQEVADARLLYGGGVMTAGAPVETGKESAANPPEPASETVTENAPEKPPENAPEPVSEVLDNERPATPKTVTRTPVAPGAPVAAAPKPTAEETAKAFREKIRKASPAIDKAMTEKESLQKAEAELEKQYGPPLFFNKEGALSSLNQPYFAALYHRRYNPIFEKGEKRFYLYNPDNGLWEKQTEEKMVNNLAVLTLDYSGRHNVPDLVKKRDFGYMTKVLGYLKAEAERKDCFKVGERRVIHCANGVLVFDVAGKRWFLRGFSPDDYSRNRSEVKYVPGAECPRFLKELIAPAMSLEDAELLQLYAGQCLLGVNLAQRFLLITGTPGGGKSTLVNILEAIIGRYNCTELRLNHIDRPFETARLLGKTLLTAKDVPSRFLNLPGAGNLKSLTGGDRRTAEFKGVPDTDGADFDGVFNVIVTSNSTLHVKMDNDEKAWARRILYIKYENPPPKNPVSEFDRLLVETEASGILNWMLEGAAKLLIAEGHITPTPEQKKRVDELLLESDSVGSFVSDCVKPDAGRNITIEDLLAGYVNYCQKRGWEQLSENQFRRRIGDVMLDIHGVTSNNGILRNGKSARGYSGMGIIYA